MEYIERYQPNVFKNEVCVTESEIKRLFSTYKIYVFGYGSLLSTYGWYGRNIYIIPEKNELIECKLKHFERGPWGIYGITNYYGVIPKKQATTNGVVVHIDNYIDWTNLMNTEMVAGLYRCANYRVVDVTQNIIDWKKSKNVRVHCVVNRPKNKEKVLNTIAHRRYYNNVWKNVKQERSEEFCKLFLESGGFKTDKGVNTFIRKLKKNN